MVERLMIFINLFKIGPQNQHFFQKNLSLWNISSNYKKFPEQLSVRTENISNSTKTFLSILINVW